MEIYIICFLIGLIGVAFQIIFKIRSLIEKANVGNIRFNWKDYFKQDMFSIILSLLSILLAEFFIRDTLEYYENSKIAMPLIKLTFATLGYAGADISSRLFGRASKMLNSIIDKKTNVADGIE
jgi:uncharacterized protein YacL